LTFEGLCSRLCQLYRTHNWADFFVLPDFPILSSDTDADIERKLTATLTAAEKALCWLPDSSRAIAVVHARTPSQVRYAVSHYAALGITYVAFGSFACCPHYPHKLIMSHIGQLALLPSHRFAQNPSGRSPITLYALPHFRHRQPFMPNQAGSLWHQANQRGHFVLVQIWRLRCCLPSLVSAGSYVQKAG